MGSFDVPLAGERAQLDAFTEDYRGAVEATLDGLTEEQARRRLVPSAKGDGVRAGMSFNDGDVLGPKIAGVKLLASPASGGRVVATLGKTDDVVFLGEEKDGYLKVQAAAGEGWVTRTLLVKR